MSISSILNMGKWALFASQAALQVTGNNVSNAQTVGYSRQEVLFDEAQAVDARPGQLGTGVEATQVVRHFDEFVESTYNDAASLRERWSEMSSLLASVETVINESNTEGLSSTLSQFFEDWQTLAQQPEDYASRESLLTNTNSLLAAIQQLDNTLRTVQIQAGSYIGQDVDRANELMRQIADVNKKINRLDNPGVNNVNQLYDDRATMVRELAEIMDINYIDNGRGNVVISTKAGHTLVDGENNYELKYESNQIIYDLSTSTTYTGQAHFSGSDDYEYTLDFTTGGTVGTTQPPAAGTAQFRVSLDGGKTWIQDPATGTDRYFYAMDEANKVRVNNIDIYFDAGAGSFVGAAGSSDGDDLTIVPKDGLYWYKTSSDKVNITPQRTLSGADNESRLTGGSLTGYFDARDNFIGAYKDKLDAFSESLIWEVNRLHSQGAGLEKMESAQGTYGARLANAALGSPSAALAYGDKLQSGGFTLNVFDSSTGKLSTNGKVAVSFQGIDTNPTMAGVQDSATFDPARHTLNDVVTAINNSVASAGLTGSLTASIGLNNTLVLTSDGTHSFEFGSDSTGLMAALGLNTFFTGDSATTIGVNTTVATNQAFLNAGHVNGAGEANKGDNTTANSIADLQNKAVTITTNKEGTTTQTLAEYYNGLISNIGSNKSYVDYNLQYQTSLASQLQTQQDQVSGVNLDEELTNLIKYQHSYQAAAKLVSTADQMIQTLLGIKS